MAVEEYVNKLGKKRYQPVLESGKALWKGVNGKLVWKTHPFISDKPALFPKFWAESLARSEQRRLDRASWRAQGQDWEKSE